MSTEVTSTVRIGQAHVRAGLKIKQRLIERVIRKSVQRFLREDHAQTKT